MLTDARNRNISSVRRARAALTPWIVFAACASGCAHQTEVRYQVPLGSDEARLCARLCSKRYPTERGSYARCLGAVEQDDAKCPPPNAEAKTACAEDRREDVGLAAIVGSTVVVGALALFALLQ
jgi:hypothetical protein